MSAEAMLELKTADWLEACQEIDRLRADLNRLREKNDRQVFRVAEAQALALRLRADLARTLDVLEAIVTGDDPIDEAFVEARAVLDDLRGAEHPRA